AGQQMRPSQGVMFPGAPRRQRCPEPFGFASEAGQAEGQGMYPPLLMEDTAVSQKLLRLGQDRQRLLPRPPRGVGGQTDAQLRPQVGRVEQGRPDLLRQVVVRLLAEATEDLLALLPELATAGGDGAGLGDGQEVHAVQRTYSLAKEV